MNKQSFLRRLQAALSGLPESEIAERLAFYSESIEDRMEDGLSEEEAVAGMGQVETIAAQIRGELPQPPAEGMKGEPRRLQGWEILLLVLGFPLWLPLLIAAFVLLLSGWIVLWALVLCLWAVELSLVAGAFGGLAAALQYLLHGQAAQGLLLLGAGLVLAGLAIFLFYACKAATGGAAHLTRKSAVWAWSLFQRKERTE